MKRDATAAFALAVSAAALAAWAHGPPAGREGLAGLAAIDDVIGAAVDVVRGGIGKLKTASGASIDDVVQTTADDFAKAIDKVGMDSVALAKVSTQTDTLFNQVTDAQQALKVAKLKNRIADKIALVKANNATIDLANIRSAKDLPALATSLKKANPGIQHTGLTPANMDALYKKLPPAANQKAYQDFFKQLSVAENGRPAKMPVKEWVKKNWGFFATASAAVLGAFFLANEIRNIVEEVRREEGGGGGGDGGGGGGGDEDDGKGGKVMLIVCIVIAVVIVSAGAGLAIMVMT